MGVKPEDIERAIAEGNKVLAQLRRVCPTPEELDKSIEQKSVSRESDLHDEILDFCRKRGWLAIHSRMDKRTTTARGVSDFIIVAPHTVYFIECKRPGKKPTSQQLDFLVHVHKLGWPNAIVHSMDEFRTFVDGTPWP